MGYTTYCNRYDLDRGDGFVEVEGVEVDADKGVTKAKVVTASAKAAPKKTAASTK